MDQFRHTLYSIVLLYYSYSILLFKISIPTRFFQSEYIFFFPQTAHCATLQDSVYPLRRGAYRPSRRNAILPVSAIAQPPLIAS